MTSAFATLMVHSAPQITTQPQSQCASADTNVLFTVVATGTAPPTSQWRFHGTTILGATRAGTYTRMNVQSADAGNYSVLVASMVGAVVSSNAILTVNDPPSITTQPQPQALNIGGMASRVS